MDLVVKGLAANRKLPALSEKSWLRYATFAALYAAQGLPEGFLVYAVPAWLAKQGRTPAEIGTFVAFSLLPWSFKLINAPLMDRWTFLPMGRRRPWVLVGQAGLLLTFFGLAWLPDPANNLGWLTAFGFCVAFFASFQDVAVDGMAIDVLPVEQQARANGIMWGSKVAGISTSVAVGSAVINRVGFGKAVLLFSIGILVIMLFPLLFRERPGERVLPWTEGEPSPEALAAQLHDWRTIIRSLLRVFFLPVSLVMGVAAFSVSIGRGLMDALLPVMTVQELGWLDTEYSNVFATASLLAGIGGMLIGGAVVDFFGKVRMMALFLVGLIALVVAMSLAAPMWDQRQIVVGFIVAFYTLYCFFTISVFATAMQLCWRRVSASQFTLYMAVSNLGLSVGAWIFGVLATHFEYPKVIFAFVVFAGLALGLVRFVRLENHGKALNALNVSGSDLGAGPNVNAQR
jgi:PAT family beta-lactamase induction signal transducer AmpG